MSKELNNPLDNSDVPIRETNKSATAGLFESIEQAQQYKLYLETLELVAKLKGAAGDVEMSIVVGRDPTDPKKDMVKKVKIRELIPRESEFERSRRLVISSLNTMSDETLRVWMARFSTDNIFELSSRITSYSIDARKRKEATEMFDPWKGATSTARP